MNTSDDKAHRIFNLFVTLTDDGTNTVNTSIGRAAFIDACSTRYGISVEECERLWRVMCLAYSLGILDGTRDTRISLTSYVR